jgi:glutaredoxin 3
MKPVEIYLTQTCPYCIAARTLLKKKGVAFREIDVGANPALRAKMTQMTGRTSVPQIFIGTTHVGGCDDLHALDRQGKLDAMLA